MADPRLLGALPDRINYTIYGGMLYLSKNERWLYYETLATKDACSGSAEACVNYGVARVDLQQELRVVQSPLPPACGLATFTIAGDDGMVVACRQGGALHVTPSTVLPLVGNAPAGTSRVDKPSVKGNWNQLEVAFERPDGTLGLLMTDGQLVIARGDAVLQSLPVLPTGSVLYRLARPTVRDGVLSVAYQSKPGRGASGIARIDIQSVQVTTTALADGTLWVVDGKESILSVTEDSDGVSIQDRARGQATKLFLSGLDQGWALGD
jgi:hypothetical protein